jgi:hypothetical protein
MSARLLIVGNPQPFHVGGHLLAAARALGLDAEVADVRAAHGGRLFESLSRRLWDRRPPWIRAFESRVLRACERQRPTWLLATGKVPLERTTLEAIGRSGVRRLAFLTDDPWNPVHRSRWFQNALPAYDAVFSPRRSNLPDLAAAGCREVHYLPFGYNPDQHHPERAPDPDQLQKLRCDLLFVGGADRDRVPLLVPLLEAGLQVALYGGYWDSFPETRAAARGHADTATLRQVTDAAKVTLVLVRRANRDGHVMRTFEAAASGACMLVEDTPEHRCLFGADGECVAYFRTVAEMVAQAGRLVADGALRRRLAAATHRRIAIEGRHTYADRLRAMLSAVPA